MPRNPLIETESPATNQLTPITFRSITCKILCTNVFFTDSELNQGLLSPCHHAWRSGNVINRILQITDVVREHLCVDGTGCPLPSALAWRDAGKRWNKVKVSGYLFAIAQSVHKRGIFDGSIRIKKKDRWVMFFYRYGGKHTQKGSYTDASCEENCRS